MGLHPGSTALAGVSPVFRAKRSFLSIVVGCNVKPLQSHYTKPGLRGRTAFTIRLNVWHRVINMIVLCSCM